jgi:hypothetical protein
MCRAELTLRLIAGSPQPVITAHKQMKAAGSLIGHDQAPTAAPIIQICARRGLRCHASVGAQIGGSARVLPELLGHSV